MAFVWAPLNTLCVPRTEINDAKNANVLENPSPKWVLVEIKNSQSGVQDTLFFGQPRPEFDSLRFSRSSVGVQESTGIGRCGVAAGDFDTKIKLKDVFLEVGGIEYDPVGYLEIKFHFFTSLDHSTEFNLRTSVKTFQRNSSRYPGTFEILKHALDPNAKANRGYSWHLTDKNLRNAPGLYREVPMRKKK